MWNVGSIDTSQELAVDEPGRKSAIEVDERKRKGAEVAEFKKKFAVEQRPVVQSKQHLQSRHHRNKRGRRLAIAVTAIGVLAIAYVVWKYVWPLLR